jgi:hypothetical protein
MTPSATSGVKKSVEPVVHSLGKSQVDPVQLAIAIGQKFRMAHTCTHTTAFF